jgi:hypothetical protein
VIRETLIAIAVLLFVWTPIASAVGIYLPQWVLG